MRKLSQSENNVNIKNKTKKNNYLTKFIILAWYVCVKLLQIKQENNQ